MDDAMLKRESGQYDLELIQRLYLEEQFIKIITNTQLLIGLRDLSLAHNEIVTIQGLSHLTNLHRLDLSYNKIRLVNGLEGLHRLDWLDLSFNKIESLNDTMDHLRELPKLMSLKLGESVDDKLASISKGNGIQIANTGGGALTSSVRINSCCTSKNYPLLVFETLPQLLVLDGALVDLLKATVMEEMFELATRNGKNASRNSSTEASIEELEQAESWMPAGLLAAANNNNTAKELLRSSDRERDNIPQNCSIGEAIENTYHNNQINAGTNVNVGDIAGLCGSNGNSIAFASVIDTQAAIASTLKEECSHLLRKADSLIQKKIGSS